MYEDGWYSIVPEISNKKPAISSQPLAHHRKESLLHHSSGLGQVSANAVELDNASELAREAANTPAEPTLIRRAVSFSGLYDAVADGRHGRPFRQRAGKRTDARARGWEALALCPGNAGLLAYDDTPASPDPYDLELLERSQQKYLRYTDELRLTERHLDGLINDANEALRLLTTLSSSFQSVEAQTRSFQSQCEGLVSEQERLEKLANEVGTDLHYYAYLETATRRLNGPGASRLVDDDDFGGMVANIDSCIVFMHDHETYRERDSYLARFHALLAKALHLADHGFTTHLEKVSSEVARQLAATKSESARHALAYGRFVEMMGESHSLLPNIRRVVQRAYDPYGQPVESTLTTPNYASASIDMFRTYFSTRDRDLQLVTQHQVDEYRREAGEVSVERASRNFIKQSFERMHDEEQLFVHVFDLEPVWSNVPESVFQTIKTMNTAMVHPGNVVPLATNVQSVLQGAQLREICGVVGWLANEYAIAGESDEEETAAFRKYREYAVRLLTDHLWAFTDGAFEAEISRSLSRAVLSDASLQIGPVVGGVASSNAHPLVKRAMELLAMFDQAMPKERSTKNSLVVFQVVRETMQVLQRAEARIKSLRIETDADLFMVKNLLIVKNELVSLEIGDIRSQPSMQHFGQIWDALSPHKWVGFLGNILSSGLWPRGGGGSLSMDDMSEQLDEALRRSIYAFTKRWGSLMLGDARRRPEVEAELDGVLQTAFSNQPEVMAKLKEAIELNIKAQGE